MTARHALLVLLVAAALAGCAGTPTTPVAVTEIAGLAGEGSDPAVEYVGRAWTIALPVFDVAAQRDAIVAYGKRAGYRVECADVPELACLLNADAKEPVKLVVEAGILRTTVTEDQVGPDGKLKP